jgi:ElaB/YqjD/DUF883 family membrane-anchored ribosome-binding protein
MDAFDTAETAVQAFEEAAARTAEIRARVEDRAAAARDWAIDQTDVIRDTVQTKPFIAVGVSAASAFAAGLIIGILLTRR